MASPIRPAAAAHANKRTQPVRADARKPGAFAQLVKWLLLALVTNVALSRALTQSWTWGYDGKWVNPRTYRELVRPTAPVILSEAQLALHDGTRPDRYPLYLAFDGDVYDISDGGMRNYGPGGAYHQFAGKDAARAFVTGCFKTHLTHDLRGLTQDQLAIVSNWKNFYRNHAKYRHIGKVVHPPIDPSSPIPPPCNDAKAQPGGAYFLLPSYVKPFFSSVTALLTSILYVTAFALVLVCVLVLALVAEKAYRRWWLGQAPPPGGATPGRLGEAAPNEGPEALRRARRFTREARMDAVAEKVIESFEQTSIGRELVRRRNKRNAAKSSTGGTASATTKKRSGGQVGGEAYELRDMGSSSSTTTARTTARRRTPPPLPAR
ncbi:hypothetical protein JCM10908_004567 [Rhodotorula pacifica]|uniref:cytochrome b5-like heme/steroid binding domain-containing protein n=1 Tax=Rhodotorula pacifica TaxID=1495444 RepID=UPI0031823626